MDGRHDKLTRLEPLLGIGKSIIPWLTSPAAVPSRDWLRELLRAEPEADIGVLLAS